MMQLESLSPKARAQRYRELAREQLRLAGSGDAAEIQAAYLELAALWTRLAEEADRQPQDAAAWGEAAPAADEMASP